ncbi:MAG: DUF2165 family protein [Aestuariivita sp.]|nr:DUF2165 family protein [Aestuariivita sp.]
MFESMVLIAQTVSLASIAAWLTTGVYDNIRHPLNNEFYTAQVLSMNLLKKDFPNEYARVSNRAITNRTLQRCAFSFAVSIEAVTCLILWTGCIALSLSIIWPSIVVEAKTLALLGAVTFSSIWSGFLIIGNYFCYWYTHEGIQNTHFQMTLWGMANILLLTAA